MNYVIHIISIAIILIVLIIVYSELVPCGQLD